jgi:competence transcription factor ComK
MIFAGTPPIITLSGKMPLTTAPAATTELFPTTQPSKKVAFAPTQMSREKTKKSNSQFFLDFYLKI